MSGWSEPLPVAPHALVQAAETGQEPPFAVEVKIHVKVGNFIKKQKTCQCWLVEQARSLETAGLPFRIGHTMTSLVSA